MGKPRNQFSRASVDLGSDTPKREWRMSHAGTLREGDLIQYFGLIEKKELLGGAFRFTNPTGAEAMFGWSTELYAFTASGDDASTPASQTPEFFGA